MFTVVDSFRVDQYGNRIPERRLPSGNFESLTEHDLQVVCSEREIARLRRLRNGYHPFREFVETDQQFHYLAFVRWQYNTGRIGGYNDWSRLLNEQ